MWSMPWQGYSQLSEKAHDNQERFLRTGQKQKSPLSLRNAERTIDGATDWSASPQSRKSDRVSWKTFQSQESSRYSLVWIYKWKSCLTNLTDVDNEMTGLLDEHSTADVFSPDFRKTFQLCFP